MRLCAIKLRFSNFIKIRAYIYETMRIISLTVLVVLLSATNIVAREVPAYKHHTFELSVTPTFDYRFFSWPKRQPGYATQVNDLDLPFAGFNFGVAYIYRPIRLIGISTGLDFMERGLKYGSTSHGEVNTPYGMITTPLQYHGFVFNGIVDVPVLIHLYQLINKTELEFTTGPVFNFPLFYNEKVSATSTLFGPLTKTSPDFKIYDASEIKSGSRLGWTVQLAANLPIKKSFILSVGPEMKFLSVDALVPNANYKLYPHETDFYIGLKVGFRLGSDFYKREKGVINPSSALPRY